MTGLDKLKDKSLVYGQRMPHAGCTTHSGRLFYHHYVFICMDQVSHIRRGLHIDVFGIGIEISSVTVIFNFFMIVPCRIS